MPNISTSPINVLRLEPPIPSRISLENLFKKSTPESLESLRRITLSRNDMIACLDSGSPEASINAIERYLPNLYGIIMAAEQTGSWILQNGNVSWNPVMNPKYCKTMMDVPSLRFELIMSLLALGISQRNFALALLIGASSSSTDTDGKVTAKAANHLCRAAGVFDYIRTIELPKFVHRPAVVQPLAEVREDLYSVLSTLSLAEAAEVSINTAVRKDTSPSAVAKLSVGAFEGFRAAEAKLSTVTDNSIHPSIARYAAASSNIFRVFAFKWLAANHYASSQYGLAVASIEAAHASLEAEKANIQKLVNQVDFENLGQQFKALREDIEGTRQSYVKENDTIYFEHVPSVAEITLPESKSITKLVEFTPPAAASVKIEESKETGCIVQ